MASLYKDLVRAGIPTDHHESDLYVLDTPEARETIKKYGYKFTTFTSDIDGKRWIDVPFAYEPFWEKKEKARKGAPSGERAVEATTRKPSHARKRGAWPSVVGSHGLGTAAVRTGDGAYWIVTVPTGYRVDYKPWGPSNEIDLGTFPSRQRARAKISEHAGGASTVRSHATKKRSHTSMRRPASGSAWTTEHKASGAAVIERNAFGSKLTVVPVNWSDPSGPANWSVTRGSSRQADFDHKHGRAATAKGAKDAAMQAAKALQR